MRARHPMTALVAVLLAACAGGTPVVAPKPGPATPKPSGTSAATPGPKDPGTATPGGIAATALRGRVLAIDGKPAAKVAVLAYFLSENGGGLIGNNGGGVVSTQGGKIVSDNGGGFVGKTRYGLAQADAAAALSLTTDVEGRFDLQIPAGMVANVEAVATEKLKGIVQGATSGGGEIVVQLAPTGAISGRVEAPGVTNLLGVDVFVPGTAHTAKTDEQGRYVLDGMPIGKFRLVAQKATLGTAEAKDVAVASEATTTAPTLTLQANVPRITRLDPPAGGLGTEVTIVGENFGQATGAALRVTVDGLEVASPSRIDDRTITFRMPDKASAGVVSVTVDGVQGEPATFGIVSGLDIQAAREHLKVGATQALTGTGRGAKGPVADVPLTWAIAEGDAATIDAKGVLKARAPGIVTVAAAAGGLKATRNFRVTPGATGNPMGFYVNGGSLSGGVAGSGLAADDALLLFAGTDTFRVDVDAFLASPSTDHVKRIASADKASAAALRQVATAVGLPDATFAVSTWEGGLFRVGPTGAVTSWVAPPPGELDCEAPSVDAGGVVRHLPCSSAPSLAIAPDGAAYLAGDGTGVIRVAPDGTTSRLAVASGLADPRTLALHGTTLYVGGADGKVRVVDLAAADHPVTATLSFELKHNEGPTAPLLGVNAAGDLYALIEVEGIWRVPAGTTTPVKVASDFSRTGGYDDPIGLSLPAVSDVYGMQIDKKGRIFLGGSTPYMIEP